MTQEQLAEEVGLSARQMKRIESGDADTRLSVMDRIAAALGATPAALLEPPTRVVERRPGRPRNS